MFTGTSIVGAIEDMISGAGLGSTKYVDSGVSDFNNICNKARFVKPSVNTLIFCSDDLFAVPSDASFRA